MLADQPIAFWNDASYTDITGHHYNGTVMNAPAATALPNGDRSLLFNGANQYIEVIADHWLSSLIELESRAQAIIQQIKKLIELLR